MWRRLLIVIGLAAAAAYVLRRRSVTSSPVDDVDPAEELRRKLDSVRESESQSEVEPEPDAAVELATNIDEKRRTVHDRARASADDMRRSTPD